MDRRNFLKKGSLFAVAVSTFGCAIAKTNITEPITTKTNKKFVGDCTTTDDILGPFYRKGAPIREDLTSSKFDAKRIVIKGCVFSEDCTTPLEGALVEFWQADPEGAYDNETDKFLFRGRQIANEKGGFSFTTFMPGKYLNGELYRPSHIHFRVRGANHKELISQIYFKGDVDIAADPWASNPKAELRILETGKLEDELETIVFDIYLAK